MNAEKIKKYANLIAVKGANVQPGQSVFIRAGLDQPEFIRQLAEECYKAGASMVKVDWDDMCLKKLDILNQSLDTLGMVPVWEEDLWKFKADKLPAMIYILSDDPDGLNGIDQDKWAKAQQERYKVIRPYRESMENKYQWCIAAVPGVQWARKVFPGISDAEAVDKLWDAILKCTRADGDDPIADWREHSRDILSRCDYLNSLKITRLKYKSASTGTDFSIGLVPNCLFMGGEDTVVGSGVAYNANMPTEEVFTTPMKGDAEGIVYATRPLSYRGVLIENFSIRFENGRVSEVHAEKNEEALKLMVKMDDGASMLGECALVPYDSPIRKSDILFYETLFDENAACHLALGAGYYCFKGYESATAEEAHALGVNDSMIHEDFMIGSDDLNITALCEDGREIEIFRNGNWAF